MMTRPISSFTFRKEREKEPEECEAYDRKAGPGVAIISNVPEIKRLHNRKFLWSSCRKGTIINFKKKVSSSYINDIVYDAMRDIKVVLELIHVAWI